MSTGGSSVRSGQSSSAHSWAILHTTIAVMKSFYRKQITL